MTTMKHLLAKKILKKYKVRLYKLITEMTDVGITASDAESTNSEYICRTRKYLHQNMQGVLKGKSIKESDLQSNSRVSKWLETHNALFGELLLEQFVQGNICNGAVRRDKWPEIVATLNRKLGTNYTGSSVMTRFKNMKADFRTLFQLSNRSGWGWDEQTHMPVAPDEIWDELLKTSPKLRRFRRNPFRQYHIFEKICGDNIATGSLAQSSRPSSSRGTFAMEDLENSDNLPTVDEFMVSQGVNFVDEALFETPTEDDVMEIERPGSKRRSTEKLPTRRKGRKANKDQDGVQSLLLQNSQNAEEIRQIMNKHNRYSMDDCLEKLSMIPNISEEGILACIDAIKNCSDSKMVLMKLEGNLLKRWIEQVVAADPRYYASSAWV